MSRRAETGWDRIEKRDGCGVCCACGVPFKVRQASGIRLAQEYTQLMEMPPSPPRAICAGAAASRGSVDGGWRMRMRQRRILGSRNTTRLILSGQLVG